MRWYLSLLPCNFVREGRPDEAANNGIPPDKHMWFQENPMKKLHSLVFYALLTPAITLGSGVSLATQGSTETPDLGEQSMGQDADPETQGAEQDKIVTKSKYNTAGPTEQKPGDQSGMESRDYMGPAPH